MIFRTLKAFKRIVLITKFCKPNFLVNKLHKVFTFLFKTFVIHLNISRIVSNVKLFYTKFPQQENFKQQKLTPTFLNFVAF